MVANPQESELWLPPGVEHTLTAPVGRNAETGGGVFEYQFKVHDPVTDRTHQFRVLVDEGTSKAHIEEMVGNAMESWLVDVRRKHNKPAPTPAQRKEIGKILDEIRIYADRRKESSNNKLYYSGLR